MIKVAFGLGADGKIRTIAEVPSGLACNCVCINCGRRLIAKKGNERVHHFAHEAEEYDRVCGPESILHALAKQAVLEHGVIKLPDMFVRGRPLALDKRVYAQPGTVELEYRGLGADIIPDVHFVARGTDQHGNIEFVVTNDVDAAKAARYREIGQAAFKVELGQFRNSLTEAELIDLILYSAPRSWIYSPRIAAEEARIAEEEAAEQARLAAVQALARQAREREHAAQVAILQAQRDQQTRVGWWRAFHRAADELEMYGLNCRTVLGKPAYRDVRWQ